MNIERKRLSTKNSIASKLSFKNEGEIETVSDKQKLSSSLVDHPYQQIRKGILLPKIKEQQTVNQIHMNKERAPGKVTT